MRIEQFSKRDIPALTAHSQTIGWYQSADWEDFIGTGDVLGHRQDSGEIVSSAYLGRFADRLGWIGAFIVNPRFQGKGLGKALIGACVARHGQGGATLGLVATEEGKSMYQKSGFAEIGSTYKLVAEEGFRLPGGDVPDGLAIREAVSAADMATVARLDLAAVGYDRVRLLNVRLKRAVKTFVAADAAGAIIGFISGAPDSQRLILGPLVAPDADCALSLITRLSRHWNGCMRIDVPCRQPALIRTLLERGFLQERVCPVMTYGRRPLPAESSRYFALVGQAFG